MQGHLTAPSIEDIERLGRQILSALPNELRRHISVLAVRVEDFPDEETEEELDLETPFDLLGLYLSQELPWGGSIPQPAHPDTILLYRRAILDHWCETGEDLAAVIRYVLIHEIGNHAGFSQADMDRLAADPE